MSEKRRVPRFKYGNCFIGAIVLMIWLRSNHLVLMRAIDADGRDTWIPHFGVADAEGNLWDFNIKRFVITGPLWFLWFKGEYQIYKKAS